MLYALALLDAHSFHCPLRLAGSELCSATALEYERDNEVWDALRPEDGVTLVEEPSRCLVMLSLGLEHSVLVENPDQIVISPEG